MTNSNERRARDVDWFKTRTYASGKHGAGRRIRRAYGNPSAYLVGLVGLPVSIALAATDPFSWPQWVYTPLIFLSGMPGWNMVRSWAEDLKFPAYSFRGAAGQFWLYLGGALPQAIRALRKQP